MEKNWEEIRKLARDYAREGMDKGLNCAESVFSALIRSGAIDAPIESVACVTGFGSGGGGAGFTCGALVSAILANSMQYGRKKPFSAEHGRMELRERYYPRYNHIVSDFAKENGSGLCYEIINQFPEGYKDEACRPNCIRVCSVAAEIAVDYLQMDADEAAKLEYDPNIVRIKNWV